MLDLIKNIDTLIFLHINKGWANSVFDIILPFITEFKNFTIALGIIALWILYKKRLKALEIFLIIAFAILVSDQLSSHVLKPLFSRLRPCEVLEHIRILRWCNSSAAFPSSHAANSIAVATILFFYFRKLGIIILLAIIVFAIGISRIYIGVHYPLDVLGGWLLGFGSAFLIYKIRKKIFKG